MSLLWVTAAGRWYHGTSVDLGGKDVLPAGDERLTNWDTAGSADHAHVTSDLDNAWYYAHAAAQSGGRPRVYQVHPKGLSDDPWADAPEVEKRASSARVLSELPHAPEPCHWCDEFSQHPEDFD